MIKFSQIMEVHQQQGYGWHVTVWLGDYLGQGYNPNPKTSKLTHF